MMDGSIDERDGIDQQDRYTGTRAHNYRSADG